MLTVKTLIDSEMDNSKNTFFSKVKSLFKNDSKNIPRAEFVGDRGGNYNYLFSYNGEKNLGEIGPVKDYKLDYAILRLRSWQSYHENEITQTIVNRFTMWKIGNGLKLQSEPVKLILESEGVKLNIQNFRKNVEAQFNMWAKSKYSDHSQMSSFNGLSFEADKNCILGGDVLVILRYDNDNVNVQLVDGCHVQSPSYGTELAPQLLGNGNRIINGIELDKTGKHVRYFVRQKDYSIATIDAFGKDSGLQMAFLVYGLKYRIDNVRGVPLFAVVLETLKKIERYKEATVGSAEERQKIIMQVVHDIGSTGENPQNKGLAAAMNWTNSIDNDLPQDINGEQLANKIFASTNKNTYNMPPGSELKGLESKNELYFKDFHEVLFDIVAAVCEIPPSVAKSLYTDSYSASRAAIVDWAHTLDVKRTYFSSQLHQRVFEFWLECRVLTNKIQAPGYLNAKIKNNTMILDAYCSARFSGANVGHIDPLKEVKAEREKLGVTGTTIPLTTVEAATEALGGGESSHNMEQYALELEESKRLKLLRS